jgi:hypothetical protein
LGEFLPFQTFEEAGEFPKHGSFVFEHVTQSLVDTDVTYQLLQSSQEGPMLLLALQDHTLLMKFIKLFIIYMNR